MWKSRSFWRLYLPFAGLIIVLATTIGVVTSRWQQVELDKRLSQQLRGVVHVLREHVADKLQEDDLEGLQLTIRRLSAETKMRMTLIDAEGKVLADSHEDPQVMDNHLNRREFTLAKQEADDIGESTRMSATLKFPMRYVGIVIKHEGDVLGFARVALPRKEVDDQVAAIQWRVIQLCIVVALVSLLLTERVVARVISPTVRLMSQAKDLAADHLQHVDTIRQSDEIETLGQTLTQLSQELGRRMEQLQESNEQLETMLRGMVEGVIAIDAEERILFANQAACEMLQIEMPGDRGRMLWELVRNQPVEEAVHQAMNQVGASRCELNLPGTDTRTLAVNVTRIPGETPTGVILVFHDVTDLRRLENLRSEFVANVSHELKTPLASIQAYSETLLNGALEDKDNNRKFVQTISRQADRLHLLIQDMLSLAKFESREEVFDLTAVDVGDVVNLCLERHDRQARQEEVELRATGPDESIYVLADSEALQQILDNLIDNAIKYSSPGDRVEVKWKVVDQMLLAEVTDTGIGIAPEHQDRVFERFYRVDKARSREVGGTGLGLAIVKHLVNACQGEIELKSTLEVGTTFIIRLPLAEIPV